MKNVCLQSINVGGSFFLHKKYFNKVQKVFAIGQDAQRWYRFWGFESTRIVPFSYSVEDFKSKYPVPDLTDQPVKFLFVGRLVKLKGTRKLISVFNKLDGSAQLDVIGEGPELSGLLQMQQSNNKNLLINYLGSMPNQKIREIMFNYDCLVLPSLYDGWGAVVNEALMSGLFIICSNKNVGSLPNGMP